MMSVKQHLTTLGFIIIISFYASINRGISPKVKSEFPSIKLATKEEVILPNKLNPNWVSGFCAGDGGFSVGIRETTGQIYFRFHITQHSRDISLMKLLIAFFNCGNVIQRSNNNRCDYYVQDFVKICSYVIPHFDEYPLYNIKTLDYLDFKKAIELFQAGGRNSTIAIKDIISNMNSKRK